jgi:hypothetical protein
VIELAGLVRAAFEREFELAFEAAVPDANERLEARRLGVRYLDQKFVRGR